MTLDLTFRGLTVQAAAALIAAAESIVGFEDTAASVAKPAHRKPPAKKQTKAEKAALELINPAVEAPIGVEEAPAEASTGFTQRRRRARPGASATAAPTPSGANDSAVATKPTFPSDAEVSDKDLVIAATHAADKKTPAFVLDKLAEYNVGQVGDLKQDVRQEFINAMME